MSASNYLSIAVDTEVSNGMEKILVSETEDGDENSCFEIDSGCVVLCVRVCVRACVCVFAASSFACLVRLCLERIGWSHMKVDKYCSPPIFLGRAGQSLLKYGYYRHL